jgi:hypothetical protein
MEHNLGHCIKILLNGWLIRKKLEEYVGIRVNGNQRDIISKATA